LDVIIDEANRLNVLVNDILELSKIQSNIIDFEYKRFDLKELIDNIIQKYDILVQKEGFIFEIESPEKVIINADKKRIEQVLYNLIDNAIKYTGSDKLIKINITIEKDKYIVKVIDTGKGIKSKDLNVIW